MDDHPTSSIPVVDLFAGPGGLGEGFAACHHLTATHDQPIFKLGLSVEKDKYAHQTLLIRSFLRKFDGDTPGEYHDFLANGGREGLDKLLEAYPEQAAAASAEARQLTLGSDETHAQVRASIENLTKDRDAWVLVGGPPCQAYSIAGRSRNRAKKEYRPEEDERHYLYREFLKVLGESRPPVFLLENVKGLVSATVKDKLIFEKMLSDLREPAKTISEVEVTEHDDLTYLVVPVVHTDVEQRSLLEDADKEDLRSFVVNMEDYGIPQSRHRLFLLGIRTDVVPDTIPSLERANKHIPVERVLEGLPKLRSGLSRKEDNYENWARTLEEINFQPWFPDRVNEKTPDDDVARLMRKTVQERDDLPRSRGSNYLSTKPDIDFRRDWYLRSSPDMVLNHEARAHMGPDLHRYLFAASFAAVHKQSPILSDFPSPLLPNHENVDKALESSNGHFSDRFRVQHQGRPATTVTSHISKDGHYYIHYDPAQCRSLTVREAARIQTFPDDYFFAGSRTSQYVQVGNAVPPLLAAQIAKNIHTILKDSGLV